MNLITVCDNEWSKYAEVTIRSFVENSNIVFKKIIVLTHEEMAPEAAKRLTAAGMTHTEVLPPVDQHRCMYERLRPNIKNVYRFKFPGRNLFVDADTICVGDCSDLLNYKGFWACYAGKNGNIVKKYDLEMFNGGVLLYTGSKKLYESIKTFYEDFRGQNPLGEQYLLNLAALELGLSVQALDVSFNRRWDVTPGDDLRIVHFAGENKPWKNVMADFEPYASFWRTYYNAINDEKINEGNLKGDVLAASKPQKPKPIIGQKTEAKPVNIVTTRTVRKYFNFGGLK
jgi:lipopolysaccharide biosynthesis glycosyltransferase